MSEVTSVNSKTGAVVLKAADVEAVPTSEIGQPSGVASLNGSGKLPEAQLMSSVETSSHLATEPTVYVTQEGSDTNSGLGWGQAFRTYKKALEYLESLSGKVGTIFIGDGEWDEVLVYPSRGNVYGKGGYGLRTVFKQPANTEANVLSDQHWGSPNSVGGNGGEIDKIAFNGNASAQTLTAPSTVVTSSVSVTAAGVTVEVLSATGTYPKDLLWIGGHLCSFTGNTGTSFTGVKPLNGKTFVASVEMKVKPGAGVGHGIAIQSPRVRVGKDVYVFNTVGSNVVVQGAGETEENAFNVKVECDRLQEAGRNCVEVLPFAPDGRAVNGGSEWAKAERGAVHCMSGEWHWHAHLLGSQTNIGVLAAAEMTLCSPKQTLCGIDFDNFPFDALLLDCLAINQEVNEIQMEGCSCQHACCEATNGGVIVRFYGNGASSKSLLNRFSGTFPGAIDQFACPFPSSYLVSEQNLKAISEAKGKVQVLSSRSFSPNSTLGGVIETPAGDKLTYETLEAVGTQCNLTAAEGSTTLRVSSVAGLAPSGWVTVTTQTHGAAATALRVKYGRITGSTLEECTGITEAIATGSGVAQHFLVGVGGGTSVAAADNTRVVQPGRAVTTITGEADVELGPGVVAGESAVYKTIPDPGLGLRFTSEASYRVIMQARATLKESEFTKASNVAINEAGVASNSGASGGLNAFYIDPADYPVGSTLRLRFTAGVNAVALGTNITAQLAKAASTAGAENAVTLVESEALTVTNTVIVAPEKETLNEAVSTPIAMPTTPGYYFLKVISAGAFAAKSAVAVRIRLEAKV